MGESTEQFFDRISPEYTAAIERCVPRYREMLWALLYYLPQDEPPEHVLELGCGTGNLTRLLLDRFSEATVEAVDLSAEILEQARRRLGESPRLTATHADMQTLERPEGRFDLVVSSIALHHLDDEAKAELLRRVHRWLTPGGTLAFCDQFCGATPETSARHLSRWQELSRRSGVPAEEWRRWMEHQRDHDHHASLELHERLLRSAGFVEVDCPWRFLLWTVMVARKKNS